MDMDFIHKLDENLTEGLELHYNSCFYCGGYYGPCFGEPTCATCHEFIHSEDFRLLNVQNEREVNRFESEMEKDDGDSGNDEPSEEAGAGPALVLRSNSDLERPIPEEPSPDDEEIEMEPADNRNPDQDQDPDHDREEEVEVDEGEEENMEVVEDQDQGQGRDEGNVNPGGHGLENIFYQPFEEEPPGRWPPPPEDGLANRLALLTNPRLPFECGEVTLELLNRIPPEIWAAIFRNLDDVSLLMASKVSPKWKAVVTDLFPNERWEEFVRQRWPLFNAVYPVQDWYAVYSDLIDSVPCKLCFMNLAQNPRVPQGPMPSRSLRSVRLQKEIKWLRIDHPDGIEAVPLDKLNYNWLARIHGPPQSVYQGGVFYLNLKVPQDYPIKPPMVRFLTKLFHPNVSRHGDIGIDCIQHNWTLALTIAQILLSVQSLLTDPYLDCSMEPAVADLYLNDRTVFEKIAKVWTWKYAMHDVLCH